ncbi:MAG: YceH family protein [Bryobacterales bacterium]|nr:YceH family protein [Bryobacterales bacterium]
MSLVLSPEEIRVLGVLIEKDMATPEYYPLSLNALVTACNQKNNRDPIVSYDDTVVTETLESLRSKQLIVTQSGGRVTKYGHRASELLNLNNRELAVICVLLLRGAQTLNEIKTRTQSLYNFDDPDSVETVLRRLEERGMTTLLEKQIGMREPRWTHLMTGEPMPASSGPAVHDSHQPSTHASAGAHLPLSDRVARLEAELEALRAKFGEFRKQFQ